LRTPGAAGELTAREALQQLLNGTGLTFQYLDGETVTIVPIATAPAHQGSDSRASGQKSAAGSDASSSDQRGPRADGVQKKSFWDRFRVAQVDQPETSSDASVTRDDAQSSTVKLEEIVVTATKREERLIDVPQSVSVLSANDLNKLGALQFRDFANTVPGLSFTTVGAGYSQITLRGVTAGLDIGHTVGTYTDDVPIGFTSASTLISLIAPDQGLFDVDRIEVLRGPQGTLYGASTLGGLIKYVSKRPDLENSDGEVRSGISGTQDGGVSYDGSLAINMPIISDKLALRASAFESHDGGYVNNVALDQKDVDRSDVYGGRIDLLYAPTDALNVRINGFLQNISRDGQATADYTLAGAPMYGSLDQSRVFREEYDQQFRLASATVTYDFGPAMLTSVSGYQTQRTDFTIDISGQFLPILALCPPFCINSYSGVGYPNSQSANKFTQEVRLASKGNKLLEWLIGGFYTHETSANVADITTLGLAGQLVPNNLFHDSYPFSYNEYAAFGDLTYHFSEKFDVQGGVRYARNDQSFTQNGSGILIGSSPTRTSEDDASTYLGVARYHFNSNSTGYLRYATGYRPGGPNTVANDPLTGLPVAPPTFQPDHLASYEVGYKAETADHKFSVDVDGYYIHWKDIHILAAVNGIGITANAPGGATIRGSELTLTVRPNNALALTGAFAYQDARLAAADTNLGATDGERLPNVPRFTAAMNADYQPTHGGWQPTLGATLRYVSNRWASWDNNTTFPQYYLPSYTVFDLRTGLTINSIDVQLYVHNLFNERGELSADTSRGPAQASLLQPRTIGVNATMRF
jgi:iron complex outermembrane receptor protein